ncbi:MAG: MFS transporter [Candidatus Woesearchaeota archaeon]
MPSKKRNVFWMGIVSMLTDISSEMIFPIIPIFLNTVLRANQAVIGIIEGVAESTASILKLFSGWLSDKIQRRKLLVLVGYGLSAITKPFLAIVVIWQQVLVLRFLDRVGKGIRTSPRDALIAESSTKKTRGRAFGLHRFLDNMGAVLGSLLAAYILWKLPNSYKTIFWLATIPGVASVIVGLIFIKDIKKRIQKEQMKNTKISLKGLNKNFRKFIIVTSLFSLANFSYAFFILRASSLKVAIALIPVVYLASNIAAAAFSLPAGYLADRLGRKRMLFAGYLLFGGLCAGFAFAFSPVHAWILFIAYGIALAIIDTVSRTFASEIAGERTRGIAIGTYHAFIGIMLLPANIIIGIIFKNLGEFFGFLYAATISLIAAIFLFLLVKDSVRDHSKLKLNKDI